MGEVTEESLLDYFYSAGGDSGKVRNADLLKTYKPYIGHNDLQLRAKYREEFKLIMDRIAVMKSENGEKFLVLRKKYRQMLVDRSGGPQEPPGAGGATCSPARPPAAVPWEAAAAAPETYSPVPAKRPLQDLSDEGPLGGSDGGPSPWDTEPGETGEGADLPSSLESESERDEESLGHTIALDPIEKDWIYSAACARVPDLSQLLQQDPSLANKKDFTSGFTALHWAAKHGKEDMASLVVGAGADINTKSHGGYTPLHIAALHGHQHMVDLLLQTYGAKNNLRDYSGHLASQYLNDAEPEEPEEESETPFLVTQARERVRNRKLPSLFLSKKKWGSAEELGPIEEERSVPPQPQAPAFRPRKFSR